MKEYTFPDRTAAGEALAQALAHYQGRPDVVVLALPRGGVPIAFEIARALRAPLDVFLVRKLGVPRYEELAMGAIASGGTLVLNEAVLSNLHITRDQLEEVAARERHELERREQVFRDGRPPVPVRDRMVIVVDDGLATGSTMRAAVQALRQQNPKRLVVAVPVASADVCAEFESLVDEVICLYTPEPFIAVGRWYDDFDQLDDDQVRGYLERAGHEMAH